MLSGRRRWQILLHGTPGSRGRPIRSSSSSSSSPGYLRRTCAVAKGLTVGRTVEGRAVAGLRPERIDPREAPPPSVPRRPPPTPLPVWKLNMRPPLIRSPFGPWHIHARHTTVPSPPTTILLFTHTRRVYYNTRVFRNSKYNKSMKYIFLFFFFCDPCHNTWKLFRTIMLKYNILNGLDALTFVRYEKKKNKNKLELWFW